MGVFMQPVWDELQYAWDDPTLPTAGLAVGKLTKPLPTVGR